MPMNTTVYYVKYCGLPFSLKPSGPPIHSEKKGQLEPFDWIVRRRPKLDVRLFTIGTMLRRVWYAQEWPK